MSRLRRMALENYDEHYARVNAGGIPSGPGRPRALELMYGDLINGLPEGSRVLDLGCGSGAFLQWLASHAGIRAVGVDVCENQVAYARRQVPEAEVLCVEGLEYLRQSPGPFGGIFCIDMLEHLPDLDDCLECVEEAWKALEPGGFFCCRTPNAASLLGSYGRYMDLTHERVFTSTSLLQLMHLGGFTEAKVLSFRAPHLSGKVRLALERALHRAVFALCGRGLERVFTGNVYAVGFKQLGTDL